MITKEEALDALDLMDDYSKMECSIDPIGAREVLTEYIEQTNKRMGELEAKAAMWEEVAAYHKTQLDAANKCIEQMEAAEPVAWCVGYQTLGGDIGEKLEWNRGKVPHSVGIEAKPLGVAKRQATPVRELLLLSHELTGVIADATHECFDHVSLKTVKRVRDVLLAAASKPAQDAKDAELLDFWENARNLEVTFECEEGGDDCWHVYKVTGSRNDREWTKIASGQTLRGAIDAAIAAQKGAQHG